MRDPEFEKHVQKKLEELQFVPSGEVWANVEQEIKKGKKRRPLFWIFLLGGILFLSGAYWTLVTTGKKTGTQNANIVPLPDGSTAKTGDSTIRISPAYAPASGTDNVRLPQNKTGQQDRPIDKTREKIHATPGHSTVSKNAVVSIKGSLNTKEKKVSTTQSVPFFALSKNGKRKKDTRLSDGPGPSRNGNHDGVPGVDTASNKKEEPGISSSFSAAASQAITDASDSSKKQLSSTLNKSADTPAAAYAAQKKEPRKKSNALQLGFTAGTGIAAINSSYRVGRGINPAFFANPAHFPSRINNGISWYAGTFLQKLVSNKIELLAGLNYHYYSTSIRTGKPGDSVVYVYAGAYNLTTNVPNTTPVPQSRYYSRGTSENYLNHYHFLELPMAMNYQLNHNRKIPLVWQGGVTLSYLVYSNALQFDPSSGVYYKNNAHFNKMQVNLMTGFALGFYHRKQFFRVGPEIDYAPSSLLNNQSITKQHFLYGGLKLSIFPNKK